MMRVIRRRIFAGLADLAMLLISWFFLLTGFVIVGETWLVRESHPMSLSTYHPTWELVMTISLIAWPILYETLPVKLWGCTLGKRIFKLRVVNARTGELPGWGSALARVPLVLSPVIAIILWQLAGLVLSGFTLTRNLLVCLPAVILIAVYPLAVIFSALASVERPGWHDRLTRTRIQQYKPA